MREQRAARARVREQQMWVRRNDKLNHELTRARRVQEIVDRANQVTRARAQRAALKERHERVEAQLEAQLEAAAQCRLRREGDVWETIGGALVVLVLLFLGGMVLHIFLGWMGVY